MIKRESRFKIVCDSCSKVIDTGSRKKDARRKMKALGWLTINEFTFCPDCVLGTDVSKTGDGNLFVGIQIEYITKIDEIDKLRKE